jgi:hypothetical protein
MTPRVRAAGRWAMRLSGAVARAPRAAGAWLASWFGGRDDQIDLPEVTLVLGLGLLFYGLSHQFDTPIACIVCGLALVGLSWPHRRSARPESGSSTARPVAPPRSRG